MMRNEPDNNGTNRTEGMRGIYESLPEERKKEIGRKARQLLANEWLSSATQANSIIKGLTERDGVSRRDILQGAAITGFGYLVTRNVWKRMFEESPYLEQKREEQVVDNKNLVDQESVEKDRSVFQAACQIGWDSFLMKIGEISTIMACNAVGIRIGNAGMLSLKSPQAHQIDKLVEKIEEQGDAYAHDLFNKICIKGPFNEEMIFRVIPSILLRDNKRHWEVGIPSAVIFAMIHNVTNQEIPINSLKLPGDKVFSLDWIPLPQFMTGVFYWYLAREFGALTPIPMHMLHNLPAASQLAGGMLSASKRLSHIKNDLASQETGTDNYDINTSSLPQNLRTSEE